jgi:hypothetical protein
VDGDEAGALGVDAGALLVDEDEPDEESDDELEPLELLEPESDDDELEPDDFAASVERCDERESLR